MKLWMAPQGLHIEPGRTEDAGTLAKIHAGSFARGWASADFAAWLAAPLRSPVYVACDARRRISGFALFRHAGAEAELITLAVAGGKRRRGVGSALLAASMTDLRLSPAREVFLEVQENNAAAIALYKKFGFAIVGERKAYYAKQSGPAGTAYLMRAALDPQA